MIELVLGADEKLRLRIDSKDSGTLTLAQLPARVRQAQAGNAEVPVVISAEKNVRYEAVVRVMDLLQREGVQRVGLSVKQGG